MQSKFNIAFQKILSEAATEHLDPNIQKILALMQQLNNGIDKNIESVLKLMLKLNANKAQSKLDKQVKQVLKLMQGLNKDKIKRDFLKMSHDLLDYLDKAGDFWGGQAGNGADLLKQALSGAMEKRRMNALHGIVDYLKAKNPMLHIKQNSVINNVMKALMKGEDTDA